MFFGCFSFVSSASLTCFGVYLSLLNFMCINELFLVQMSENVTSEHVKFSFVGLARRYASGIGLSIAMDYWP